MMNIGSSSGGGYGHSQRAEAERWLNIAQKLLAARDLHGTKTFAIRARESDPRLDSANQILAVADTLLASDFRFNDTNSSQQVDWYSILQLPRLTHSIELIATQYRKFALLLSPDRNRFPYADHAFKLVCEAWAVLSNPSRKSSYDTGLQLSQLGQLGQRTPPPHPQPQPKTVPPPAPPVQARKIPGAGKDAKVVTEEDESPSSKPPTEPTRAPTQPRTESTRIESDVPSFWTACPYCYILYEYPKVYEDCTLRCQNCKRAFHAVMIASPPVTGKNSDSGEYFCCWGFMPLGFNGNAKNIGGMGSNWSPISAMFNCPNGPNDPNGNSNKPKKSNPPRVYYDDDVYVEVSEPSDDSDDGEWQVEKRKRKGKNVKGKEARTNVGGGGGGGGTQTQVVLGLGNAETNRKGLVGSSGRKQMAKGMKDLGKLDLNVEFSNEVEDPVAGVSEENGNREEDNIEGIGFFEGLDEFLSSLPILNVVGDDKVKAS
ncbi:DnaJ domain-containing protein [Cephalotus follicularis]|uniref:DnaJ domain-containing protein n=1 Tax=Cephalotus follicularis TaxID=3775 RepID=A0A1Q3CHG8_CEPFO|nr:DnaJ domain-containing protein [Cephalotus follicularis]